jgi:hypothetical protein
MGLRPHLKTLPLLVNEVKLMGCEGCFATLFIITSPSPLNDQWEVKERQSLSSISFPLSLEAG